jgi:CheY-like chemotaxis protein
MSFEVTCASCRTSYVMDEDFAGTALPCPACGAQEGLSVPSRTRPAAGPARRPTPRSQPPVTPPATGSRSEEPEEVVCPRCKLHFVPRRATAEAANASRPTVLLVEDMEYFREIAAEALSTKFEVRDASNPDQARAQLAAGGIDVMVLDLTLGGNDAGVELLRSLPAKPCPILVYTDRDESELYGGPWEQLQRLGADDIVMKGMNAGEALARKVCGLLGLPWDEDE